MNTTETTFEVRVNVATSIKSPPPRRVLKKEENIGFMHKVKCFHIVARTASQACHRARKYGRPLGARKVDATQLFGNIEELQLEQAPNPPIDVYGADNPYESAIAMDEFIWKKRQKRLENREKDKLPLDKE